MAPETSSWLLTQGVLGFTTLMLCLVVIFMWRELKHQNSAWEKKYQDQEVKHDTELAEERKAHAQTQATRITEMQQGWVTVNKVEDTLAQTLKFVQRTT